jgi:hypothetical protein
VLAAKLPRLWTVAGMPNAEPINASGGSTAACSAVATQPMPIRAATPSVASAPPELDGGGQDAAFPAELLRRDPSLRRFLPALLEVVPF